MNLYRVTVQASLTADSQGAVASVARSLEEALGREGLTNLTVSVERLSQDVQPRWVLGQSRLGVDAAVSASPAADAPQSRDVGPERPETSGVRHFIQPSAAVLSGDRNLFIRSTWRGETKNKFRGFFLKIEGEWLYWRDQRQENLLRYVEGGALSVDAAILERMRELRIGAIVYTLNGGQLTIGREEAIRYGVFKSARDFGTAQYHVPLHRWSEVRERIKRPFVKQGVDEILLEPQEGE